MRLERELGLAVEASVQHRLDTGLRSPFFSYVNQAAESGGALALPTGLRVWLRTRC